MQAYIVKCGPLNCWIQYAESAKEAIRFTRMERMAAGMPIPDEGLSAEQVQFTACNAMPVESPTIAQEATLDPRAALVLEVVKAVSDHPQGLYHGINGACTVRLIGAILSGTALEFQAPLDMSEEEFVELIGTEFRHDHPVFDYLCVNPVQA